MNPEQKGEIVKAITEHILQALQSQEFKDWYNGKFEFFTRGEMAQDMNIAPSTAELLIKQDIHRIFNIV